MKEPRLLTPKQQKKRQRRLAHILKNEEAEDIGDLHSWRLRLSLTNKLNGRDTAIAALAEFDNEEENKMRLWRFLLRPAKAKRI